MKATQRPKRKDGNGVYLVWLYDFRRVFLTISLITGLLKYRRDESQRWLRSWLSRKMRDEQMSIHIPHVSQVYLAKVEKTEYQRSFLAARRALVMLNSFAALWHSSLQADLFSARLSHIVTVIAVAWLEVYTQLSFVFLALTSSMSLCTW